MPPVILEKNRYIVEQAVSIIVGSDTPIENTELANRLIAAGVSTLPLAATRCLLGRYLPKQAEVTGFLSSVQGHGGKVMFWAAAGSAAQPPPNRSWTPVESAAQPPPNRFAPVLAAQKELDDRNGVARTSFPHKVVRSYWVCSDGNEFSHEIDALRHELDTLQSGR